MNNRKKTGVLNLIRISVLWVILFSSGLIAGETTWMAVGDLRSWYHSAGCEIEVGRTSWTGDQQDGLQWPAQFSNQDNAAAKALWIGCTNFDDPIAGRTYPYKVIHIGPRGIDENNEFMTQKHENGDLVHDMIGKFDHPIVTVDDVGATELDFLEVVDEVDPNLISDRMLYNVVNTSMGVTMTRKIYAYTQQNHSNYFIYEYVFKNTGIYDKDGSTHNLTLTDVLFHWQYRYAIAKDACTYGGNWLPQLAREA